ncbi:hypothetical protein BST81_13100 [Leptolyngbya sp. 'hensonii']|uniref:hypothetical protein n=1 Tax=Leptolyngbya sp. 'hensonii' TaxID=1922337 RepID=UPI00094FB23C|nr:hypothetical protein [Leptolyngbya sp. 'hensonii']OLP17982.1 hypothetical protein BST81_13100 [Leptolyngbya sp. 'hensonii']
MKLAFKASQVFLSALSTTTVALTLPVVAQASTLNQSLTFTTTNQSMWAGGSSFDVSNTTPLTVSWDESGSIPSVTLVPAVVIPGVCVPFIGCSPDVQISPAINSPSVTASTKGTIGFTNTFSLTSGKVNATLPINLQLTLPDAPVLPGSSFSIGTSFALDPSASFQTVSPSISNELSLIFKVASNIDIGGLFSTGFDVDQTVSILKIDNSSLSLGYGNDYVDVTAKVPKVDTAGTVDSTNKSLTSEGADTIATGKIKVANIASAFFGLPPLSGGDSINLGPVGSLGYDYNLLTTDATLDLNALQQFKLTPTGLPAQLSFLLKDGTTSAPVSFNVGETLNLIAPTDWTGQVQATVDLDALLNNNTSLQFAPGFDISALGIGITLPIVGSQSLGPLFEISQKYPINPPISIYNNTFALDGFAPQTFGFQIPVAQVPVPPPTASVPEPTPIAGWCSISSIAIAFMLLRRRQVAA